jgi:hypothetical protein
MTPSHPRLDLLVRQLLLSVAVGRSCHRFQHRAAKSQQRSRGVLGQKPNAGNVLVTAARRPVLTCARHLSIRHRGPAARNPQAPGLL